HVLSTLSRRGSRREKHPPGVYWESIANRWQISWVVQKIAHKANSDPAQWHTGGGNWGRAWMMMTQYLSEKHPTGVSRESIANQLVLSS
ncbi:MAG: hypothetical protein WC261_14145, partial [Synergistaceae bacterium]